MKKLILTVVLAAFAVAVQAADDKSCGDKDSCCSKMKTAEQTQGGCCAAKQTKVASKGKKKADTIKVVLHSPKAKSDAS